MTTLAIESLAHGGAGVGRDDGRVMFCPDTVPGDVVQVEIVKEKKSYAVVRPVSLLESSPDRRPAPCPVFDRCGGCDWQMMDPATQRHWKRDIVRSQLVHLGGINQPAVVETRAVGPEFGYRNRIDIRVVDGRPALFEARTHRPVVIDDCPLVLPPISERLRRFDGLEDAEQVTLRASEMTGEMVEIPRRRGRWARATLRKEVAGHNFRISGRAFFQVNTAGAKQLVELVAEHLSPDSSDVLLDGYAGGGLFAATVGRAAKRIAAVESDRRARGDLAVNAPEAEVIGATFEQATLPTVTVAVVDPPRAGMGGGSGVVALVGACPDRVAYVSCDPAPLARDTALLGRSGYALDRVTPVDMFPNTHHIEAVAWFTRR